MSRKVAKAYDAITVPGIMLHEISHLVMVLLIPGISVEEVDLTSHVTHQGNYTVTRLFLVSFAPAYLNTLVSIGIFYYVMELGYNSINMYFLAIPLAILATSFGLKAMPSYEDSVSPLSLLKSKILSRHFIIAIVFGWPIFILSIPFVIASYIARQHYVLSILSEILITGSIIYVSYQLTIIL